MNALMWSALVAASIVMLGLAVGIVIIFIFMTIPIGEALSEWVEDIISKWRK